MNGAGVRVAGLDQVRVPIRTLAAPHYGSHHSPPGLQQLNPALLESNGTDAEASPTKNYSKCVEGIHKMLALSVWRKPFSVWIQMAEYGQEQE